jgi:dephospho-CoA kinase
MEGIIMLVVGLTGNIGSGKSTVSRFLKNLGARVIDTDQIARDVVAPGTRGLKEIVAQFGPGVLNPDGTLNRPKMAQIVFSDPHARARLNAIVHPEIGSVVSKAIADYRKNSDSPLLIIEAPLLIETGMHQMVDEVWLVTVNPETQIARVIQRDATTEEQARRRIAAQMPQADKIPCAHRVIDNSGDLEETVRQVRQVWNDVVNPTPSGVI